MAHQDAQAQQLMRLAGIGEITATAVVSTVGNGHDFACGRSFSAWLGLVPGQYSSGGKQRLGRITKAGDAYLHSLLVTGARAVLAAAMSSRNPQGRSLFGRSAALQRWPVDPATGGALRLASHPEKTSARAVLDRKQILTPS
jgi:transposase